MSRTEKRLATQAAELAEWCADDTNVIRLRDNPRRRIDEALSLAGSPGAAARAGAALGSIAVWVSLSGAAAVMAGRQEGWTEVERGRRYRLLHIRTLFRAYETDVRPERGARLTVNDPALVLIHSLAVGDPDSADWLATQIAGEESRGHAL